MTNMGMASVRKVHPLFFVGGVISLDRADALNCAALQKF